MVREQEVSFSEKDKRFVDVLPKSKDTSWEVKNVGLSSFSENEGIVKCVSENQTATGPPVTPIVYNAAKPNFPIVDVAVDEMNEWKNGIKLHVACDSTDGRIFNNRTHWNMRCKFLEVGLRMSGLDKIRENPDQIYEKPEGKFFIYIPIRRNKNDKKGNEEAEKMNDSRPADYMKNCSQNDSSKPEVCVKVQEVISSDNAENVSIYPNKINEESTKETKTNDFKPYDYETNGSQGDSTIKNQSIKSNFCPKEKDIVSPDNAENNIENVEMKSEILQEEQHSKSETCLCKVDEELVLEDVSDKDLVLPEVVFALPQRLTRCSEYIGDDEMSCALAVQQHEVFQNGSHPAIERSEAEVRVSLSKLERSRRRIINFFDRFRRNRVKPVDI